MEGGSNGSSCMMSFGENNNNNNNTNGDNIVSPIMMIMPHMTPTHNSNNSSSHHHHHHHHQNLHHQNHQHHNSHHNNNPNNADTGNTLMSSLFLPLPALNNNNNHHNHQNNISNSTATNTYLNMAGEISNASDSDHISSFKAKIIAHPHYHRLLSSYLNCQKVGAPPEVVARLESACRSAAADTGHVSRGCLGEDPALDQFMEAYCEMLCKYALELSKPFNEAMLFLHRVDSQFKALTVSSSDVSGCGDQGMERNGSSEEEVDVNNSLIDPLAEDRELKGQLLRRYSGYLGSLKQEFMKKRKKGKLPKEARQQLLDWWSRHYKWPYPSESQKVALAEATGLDQKQINNWFINQRKRHWKPSEDMQFVVMEAGAAAAAAAAHPHHHHNNYYMDNILFPNNHHHPFPMDISSSSLL